MYDELVRVDMNLLLALHALLEERNVTRAAERLFITQPAMSKTLGRLRKVFDDPLFTRTPKGLVPTPRAEQLQQPLGEVVSRLNALLVEEKFDPSEAEGRLNIAATEGIAGASIPALLNEFNLHAPKLTLRTINTLVNHLDLLRAGELDFSIYVHQEPGSEFSCYELSQFIPVCWMRKGHPLSKLQKLQIEDLRAYPQISLYLPQMNEAQLREVEDKLEVLGLERGGVLETAQLFTSMELISRSDIIMFAPEQLALANLASGRLFDYRKLPDLPILRDIQPSLYLIQHQRTLGSPLHRWVRDKLIEIHRLNPAK